VQGRLKQAIDELEKKDDSQWSNVKALQVAVEGSFRKRVGDYRIIFRKFPERATVGIWPF